MVVLCDDGRQLHSLNWDEDDIHLTSLFSGFMLARGIGRCSLHEASIDGMCCMSGEGWMQGLPALDIDIYLCMCCECE